MGDLDRFARDRLAGNLPEVLHGARVALLGAGAAGQSIALAMALLGFGEIAVVDPDHFEEVNATRSPFYQRGRPKAVAVAHGFLRYATAPVPRAFAWRGFAEDVGDLLGAWSSVIVSAVDTNTGRRFASDIARAYALPMIEVGFDGRRVSVSAFPATSTAACFSCGRSSVEDAPMRGLCTLYARAVEQKGAIPAVQTVAQAAGALAAEAATAFLHGEGRAEAARWTLDLRFWKAAEAELPQDAGCDGVHAPLPRPRLLKATPKDVGELFGLIKNLGIDEPTIILPEPFVLALPCEACGRSVRVRERLSLVRAPHCPAVCRPSMRPAPARIVSRVMEGDRRNFSALCLMPGSIVHVVDEAGREERIRLPGSLPDVFREIRKSNRGRMPHGGTS